MERTPVTSSNVAAVGYDPDTRTLEVEFKSGAAYSYSGVPAEIHRSLVESPSVGAYFSANIKDHYPTTRL